MHCVQAFGACLTRALFVLLLSGLSRPWKSRRSTSFWRGGDRRRRGRKRTQWFHTTNSLISGYGRTHIFMGVLFSGRSCSSGVCARIAFILNFKYPSHIIILSLLPCRMHVALWLLLLTVIQFQLQFALATARECKSRVGPESLFCMELIFAHTYISGQWLCNVRRAHNLTSTALQSTTYLSNCSYHAMVHSHIILCCCKNSCYQHATVLNRFNIPSVVTIGSSMNWSPANLFNIRTI